MKKVRAINIFFQIILAFTFFIFENVSAQKQANHWFTLDFALNFNQKPFRISPSPIPNVISKFSSISDRKGNLLFSTNNELVFDKNYNVMPNGDTGLDYENTVGGFNGNSLIIPMPNSSHYYIFMANDNNYLLAYSIVDMSLNNGLGDVVQKAKALPTKTFVKIAATGNCEKFWILASQAVEKLNGIIYILVRYKVDGDGLNKNPDTLSVGNYYNFRELKFSPNGKKLLFFTSAQKDLNGGFQTVLCNFNLDYGSLSNPISFFSGSFATGYEFSPDGTKLYVLTGYELYQFDISSNDSAAIENSKTLLYQGSKNLYINDLQLTPHGTILGHQKSEIGTGKTAIIELPNEKGLDSSFKIDAFNFYFFGGIPNFVSTFFTPILMLNLL